MEMRSRVDDVLNIWRDVSKDVSGRAALYKHPLPWIPNRLAADSGIFFTGIAGDVVDMLMTYLTYARIRKENVAWSFQSEIGQLDVKVCLAYINAFLYLSEGYQKALGSKEWYNIQGEEEFAEYITFVCAVANDIHFIVDQKLYMLEEESDWDKSLPLEGYSASLMTFSASSSFEKLMLKSIDQLSCLVFLSLFKDRESLLTEQFHSLWTNTVHILRGEKSSKRNEEVQLQLFEMIVVELVAYLEEISDFLAPVPFGHLLGVCGEKLIVLLIGLLRSIRNEGITLDNPESAKYRERLREDIRHIEMGFDRLSQLLDARNLPHLKAHLDHPRQILLRIESWIFEEIFTVAFITHVKRACEEVQANSMLSQGTHKLLQVCLALRGVQSCLPKKVWLLKMQQQTTIDEDYILSIVKGSTDVSEIDKELRELKEAYGREWAVHMLKRVRIEPFAPISAADMLSLSPTYRILSVKAEGIDLEAILLRPIASDEKIRDGLHRKQSVEMSTALTTIAATRKRVRRLILNQLTSNPLHRVSQPPMLTANKQTLTIWEISVRGALRFPVRFAVPVFVRFQLGDEVAKTSLVTMRPNAVCKFPGSVTLHLRSGLSSLQQLEVSIWADGLVISQKLASDVIEFMPFSPPSFRNKTIVFSHWSNALRVQHAIQVTKERQEALPEVTLSLNPSG
eukprot:gene31208-37716_t